jgi:AcrR family transcriptional regulator
METAETADALIQAGRRLFAERGYDGTSVRAVTAAAGANLGAITYHFGSKREFYRRVVERTVGPLARRVIEVATGPGSPLERVEALIRMYFAELGAMPELPRFLLQGLVLGGVPPEEAAAPLRQGHAAVAAVIREGQGDGSIRTGNAALMAVSILSQPVHLMLVQSALRAVMGIDLSDGPTREQAIDNAVRFAVAGLAPSPGRDG